MKEEINEGRRNFFARTVELGAAAGLGVLGIRNSLKKTAYNSPDISDAITDKKSSEVLVFAQKQRNFESSLERLSKVYRDEYYESYTAIETYMDYEGKLRTRMVTKYRWVEPNNIPKHTVIDSWLTNERYAGKLCSRLQLNPVVDGNMLENVVVSEKQTNKVAQGIVGGLIYGGEIALLLGYEEIIAHLKHQYEDLSLREKVEKDSTPEQISRRGAIKIGAAFVGAVAAFLFGQHNEKKVRENKEELEKNVKRILDEIHLPDNSSFGVYFQTSPGALISRADSYVVGSEKALRLGVKEASVRDAFENVVSLGEDYKRFIQDNFVGDIPEDVARHLKCAYITKKLESVASEQHRGAWLGLIGEALVVGGAMAALIVPAEYLNKKI